MGRKKTIHKLPKMNKKELNIIVIIFCIIVSIPIVLVIMLFQIGPEKNVEASEKPTINYEQSLKIEPNVKDPNYKSKVQQRRNIICSMDLGLIRGNRSYDPDYVGFTGYTAVSQYEDSSINDIDISDKIPPLPWKIHLMKQTGPELFEESEKTINARIKVKVLEQHLEHVGYGAYSGYLKVITDKKEVLMISPNNFSPIDYWNCNIKDAVKFGPVVAQINRNASLPVDEKGRWEKIGKDRKVLCNAIRGDGLISCYMYKKYTNGYGGVSFYFPASSLKLFN